MKKTMFNSAILAAVVSLTFTPLVSAHHPSEEMNPNFDTVDEQISDQHNLVIDAMLEEGDNEFMATTAQGMDSTTQTQAGGDSVASQDSAQSSMAGESPASNMNTSAITRAAKSQAGR